MESVRPSRSILATLLALLALAVTSAALAPSSKETKAHVPESVVASAATALNHDQEVMLSRFCAECHPAIYAEHERSTHGRAFTDNEVRLATGRFDHGDCIVCHTPRPIFETGIGMNPRRRHFDLESGNTCMTCHWKQGIDYGQFRGGAECRSAFDDRVGEVEACASCHRNHGTPYQWELSPIGKGKGQVCTDCHMPQVLRPVAVGEEPRWVSSHGFPGCREDAQLKQAYSWDASIEENEVVVKIKNRGVGHNFPTELKQRSLESLVIVKDAAGAEISRSRMVFRDPYKRPYGLRLPVNTQIPSGQSVEHRVPIKVGEGSVECELHFKLYYPIQDHHPDLARLLESDVLPFEGVTPSDKEVETAPHVQVVTPESISVAAASPANLVDFARPPIGEVEVKMPGGESEADIQKLIEYFQFPVPEANRLAQARLAEIGTPAIPQLIEALGSWDNKTYNKAKTVFGKIGEAAVPALTEALDSDNLYVRVHSRELLVQLRAGEAPGVADKLVAALRAENAMDRISATAALGELGVASAIDDITAQLEDRDPDVVREAAFALARLGRSEALPAMLAARERFIYAETQRDIALAMAYLGDHASVFVLLEGLDHDDDLIRERFFESLFEVTGLHFGYDPLAPRPERLDAISSLQGYWMQKGGDHVLRAFREVDHKLEHDLWSAIKQLGDGKRDEEIRAQLLDAGQDAVPALVKALKYPAGFATKRAMVCELLGQIGSTDAVPALIGALRDPVVSVASWACWALEQIGDREALAPVKRFERRILTLEAAGSFPPSAGSPSAVRVQTTRTRFQLGQESAVMELVKFLLSEDVEARRAAIDALRRQFGYDLDYDADGPLAERRAAAMDWSKALN